MAYTRDKKVGKRRSETFGKSSPIEASVSWDKIVAVVERILMARTKHTEAKSHLEVYEEISDQHNRKYENEHFGVRSSTAPIVGVRTVYTVHSQNVLVAANLPASFCIGMVCRSWKPTAYPIYSQRASASESCQCATLPRQGPPSSLHCRRGRAGKSTYSTRTRTLHAEL